MPEPRFQCLIAVVLGLFLTSCISSAPPSSARPGVGDTTVHEDTIPAKSLAPESTATSDDLEDAIAELRAAVVDRSYAEVVRHAQELLADSLPTEQAARIYTLLGRAEQARGNHEAALEALQEARVKAVEAGRSGTHIDRALGESYEALYRWRQAESSFQRVLDAAPKDRAARQALAEVYVQSRQWKAAQEQYRHLVRADSSNGQWWARLGRCALERDQRDQARRYFATAHRLLPQAADVALPLSRLYRATGKSQAAVRVVDTTISHQPRDPRLWRRRADLAFEQNDLEFAHRAYRQTLALGDSSATVFRRIGLIEVRQEQYERALSPLRQSHQRDSSHPRTTLYLGIAYRHLDSLQRASHYLQQTIDKEARGPITTAYTELGEAKDQQADVRAAVRSFKTALRLQPARTDLYFRLAHVYDRHYQEKATAVRYYRRFLRMSDTTQAELQTYAKNRLEALRTVLHMQEGERQSADSTGE